MGGTMRAPLMAIIFAFELTHDGNSLLPLLIASLMSYSVTVLTLKRSILTEKVARRGYHLSCEYAVDPLEILYVREVMRTNVVALPASGKLGEMQDLLRVDLDHPQEQRLLPVVDAAGEAGWSLDASGYARGDRQRRRYGVAEPVARHCAARDGGDGAE